jgi:hypothetical protein
MSGRESFGTRTEPDAVGKLPVGLADVHEHHAPLFGTLLVYGAVALTAVVVVILIVSCASSQGGGRTRRLSGEGAPFSRSARLGMSRSFDEAMEASVRCMASLTSWLSSRRARNRIERQQGRGVRRHRLLWSVFWLVVVYTYCNTDTYPLFEVLHQSDVADKRIYTDCSPSTRSPGADVTRFCFSICSPGADVAVAGSSVAVRRSRQGKALRYRHAILSQAGAAAAARCSMLQRGLARRSFARRGAAVTAQYNLRRLPVRLFVGVAAGRESAPLGA